MLKYPGQYTPPLEAIPSNFVAGPFLVLAQAVKTVRLHHIKGELSRARKFGEVLVCIPI